MPSPFTSFTRSLWKRLSLWAGGAREAIRGLPYNSESTVRVAVENGTITATFPDGIVESVRWSDLERVFVQTTADGPFAPDVFFVLVGRHSGVHFPAGATGEAEVLKQLSTLPGFNYGQVITAMGCVEECQHPCWTRPTSLA
jgi:hypothetical protein